jgi:uncharacterized membrane protein
MKRAWLIVVAGLVLALAAYAGIYFTRTAENRSIEKSSQPMLSWLQDEYHLSDEQFARVRELYTAYQPKCVEMCRKIDDQNAAVKRLLASTNSITPEIKDALAKAAQLRVECQTAMFAHFYEVAQAMPPAEGKRYLAWVQQETLMPAQMPPTKQPSSPQSP